MARSTALGIFLLVILAALTGYNYFARPFAYLAEKAQNAITPSPSPTVVLDPVTEAISSMSTEQKVAQLFGVPYVAGGVSIATEDSEQGGSTVSAKPVQTITKEWIAENKPGFIVLFGKNITKESATKLVNSLHEAADYERVSGWIAVDHEGGSVQRLNGVGFTLLPSWRDLCLMEANQRRQLLSQSAADLSVVGIDMVLAPVVDIASSHPVLKSRICGSDATEVSDRAQEFIQVFEQAHIQTVLKHFPGIGKTKKDLHRTFESITVTPEEAMVYRTILDQFPTLGVMVSHVGVTNQYKTIPCSQSVDCVSQVKYAYPETLVVSDAIEMDSAGYVESSTTKKTVPNRVIDAVEAGIDMVLFGDGVSQEDLSMSINEVVARYESNELFAHKVDAAVKKVISYKQAHSVK